MTIRQAGQGEREKFRVMECAHHWPAETKTRDGLDFWRGLPLGSSFGQDFRRQESWQNMQIDDLHVSRHMDVPPNPFSTDCDELPKPGCQRAPAMLEWKNVADFEESSKNAIDASVSPFSHDIRAPIRIFRPTASGSSDMDRHGVSDGSSSLLTLLLFDNAPQTSDLSLQKSLISKNCSIDTLMINHATDHASTSSTFFSRRPFLASSEFSVLSILVSLSFLHVH